MNSEEVARKIQPWLARQRRSAWKPIVREGVAPPAASKFCGTPWTGPDAPWPRCGNCQEPLTLFFQLDLDHLPEELGNRFGPGLLQLFYCIKEDCEGYGGWEPFGDDISRVRIVSPESSSSTSPEVGPRPLPEQAIIGWTRFDDLPSPAEHDELGLTYTYDFDRGTLRLECPEVGLDSEQPMSECEAEDIALAALGDKLGGWPHWVQGVEYPNCPTCGTRMELVFQVDSEDNVPFMFGDAGCGHITQCPQHREVVAFGWACS